LIKLWSRRLRLTLARCAGGNMSFSHMHHRQFGSIQEQERIALMDPMRLPCYKANRVIVKVLSPLPP